MSYRLTDPALPVPQALLDSLDEQWTALARAGTWWTGAERVAIASQARAAAACALCDERKAALSPYSIPDAHPGDPELPASVVDAVHRIVTDPGRLSRKWVDELLESGVPAEGLVEIAGILGVLRIGDTLARACGCAPVAFPEPVAGEPSRAVAEGLAPDGAWVSMVDPQAADGMVRAVYQDVEQAAGFVFNVVRSLTSVPAAWAAFFGTFLHSYNTHGAVRSGDLARPQMELLAASTSAVNECFY